MEPSQRRNGNHAEHYCYDNKRCLSATISEHKKKHSISITSIRLVRKACNEGSSPPAGRSLGCLNRRDPDWAAGSRISSPTDYVRCERPYRTGASMASTQTDRLGYGYMQLYKELGNELDKNYNYERILSTSTGSNSSSGI